MNSRLHTIQRERATQYVIPPQRMGRVLILQIIGGNLQSGVQMIQYVDAASDPSLSATYDPDVDTVYPTGIGNAQLLGTGAVTPPKVLVRHDFAGFTDPLMAGDAYLVSGVRPITIASGGHAGEVLTFYTVRRG